MTASQRLGNGEEPKQSAPRIVFFGQRPPPVHGASLANAEMLAALKQSGFTVDFVSFTGVSSALALRLRRTAKVVVILRSIVPLGRSAALLMRRDCLIYLPISAGLGQLREISLVSIARGRRHRIVLHHHSYSYINDETWLTAKLSQIAGRDATHVVQCETMGRDLQNTYPTARNILAISNLALMEPPAVETRLDENATRSTMVIGFLGNGSVEKGALDALEVFRTLAEDQNGHEVRFEICGPLSPEVATRAAELQDIFGSKLVLHGPRYGRERDQILAGWNVLLFPSRYRPESEGRVIHEAMALGAAVIATPVGCLRQFLPGVESAHITAEGSDFVQEAVAAIAKFEQLGWGQCSAASIAANRRLRAAATLDLENFLDTLAGVDEVADNWARHISQVQRPRADHLWQRVVSRVRSRQP